MARARMCVDDLRCPLRSVRLISFCVRLTVLPLFPYEGVLHAGRISPAIRLSLSLGHRMKYTARDPREPHRVCVIIEMSVRRSFDKPTNRESRPPSPVLVYIARPRAKPTDCFSPFRSFAAPPTECSPSREIVLVGDAANIRARLPTALRSSGKPGEQAISYRRAL